MIARLIRVLPCLFLITIVAGCGPSEDDLRRARNNLLQMALATHGFHDANGYLPTNVLDKNGKALLSWRVQILPYLEQANLYQQFKLDEAWDSDHNKKFIDLMPKIYAPVRGKAEKNQTFYQSFSGEGAFLDPKKKMNFTAIQDGLSNTLMVVEAGTSVLWSKPDDIPFDEKGVLPELGGDFDPGRRNECLHQIRGHADARPWQRDRR